MKETKIRISKRMNELRGKLRQKCENGPYYYRLTIANGLRKEFALRTTDESEAVQKAAGLDAVWEAPTKEVAFAQINAMKGFSRQNENLSLADGWEKYERHPERARPHTIAEQKSYKKTYDEFVAFATSSANGKQKNRDAISCVSELTVETAENYAAYLKTKALAVGTHNRKIKHLRKIFDCLKEYYSGENPFRAKSLFRKEREEQDTVVRRQAFSQEQEQQLLDVLADSVHKVLNKPEIRVIYYVGMFTGQRLKDCVLLQWQNIDLKQQRIWVKQFKTGKDVTIPMAPELYEILQEALKWKMNQYVCPKSAARYNRANGDGKNVGNNLINIDVLRVIRWIGLEPSVSVPGRNKKMTVYGFHSLRHSFASFCAESGIPKAVLLSILGTDSDIADKYYTHVGDASQRQAIAAVSGTMMKISPQERIEKVLKLLETKPTPTEEILIRIEKILTDGV